MTPFPSIGHSVSHISATFEQGGLRMVMVRALVSVHRFKVSQSLVL